MAIIKLKKGAGAPSGLTLAEPAFDLTNNALYIGITGGVKWIGAEVENTTLSTSNIKTPTSSVVKTYVDNQVAGITSGVVTSIAGITGAVGLTGTANQIIYSQAGKNITLALPTAMTVPGTLNVTGDLTVTGNDILSSTGTVITFSGTDAIFAKDVTVNANANIVGNLTVNGTTTYVNSTVTEIADPIITLGWTGGINPMPTDDNKDRGIAFKYNLSGGRTGFFGYDDSGQIFTFVPQATITGEVVSGSAGDAVFRSVILTNQANDFGSQPRAGLTADTLSSSRTYIFPDHTGRVVVPSDLGTSGFILRAAGTSSQPTWVNPNAAGFTAYMAQEIAGGAAGNLHYQSAADNTSFVSNAGSTGFLLTYNTATNTPTWANPNTIGITAYGSTVAVNIQGGAAGSLPYNTAANTTTFLNIGTANFILRSTGTAPAWVNANAAGFTAYAAQEVVGGAAGNLLYQSGVDVTSFVSNAGATAFVLTYNTATNTPTWANINTAGFTAFAAQSATTATNADNIAIATETSDTTCFLVFSTTNSSGYTPAKVNSALTFNAATNYIDANIDGGAY